jgi:hypothetical protein
MPARAPASAVWRADGLGAFLRTSWNTVGAMPPQVHGGEVSFQLTGRGQRSELEPALPAVHEGDQHDVTFSVRLDGELATDSQAHQVIARWENDSPGRSPLDLRVDDGELLLHGGEGHPSGPRTFTRALGPAPIGGWTRLRILVRFSADPHKAGVSVWRDGRSVVDDHHPRGGTLYPGQQSYLKVGLHRDRTIATPTTVRFSGWSIHHEGGAAGPRRMGPTGNDTPARVRPSTGASDVGRRSPRAGTSVRPASDGSGRDAGRHASTNERDTSPSDRSDREESQAGSSSERSSTSSSEPGRHSSQSDTSGRRTPERLSTDDSASTPRHRSEPSRRTSPPATTPRGTSRDAGSHEGADRAGRSADVRAGSGDDSGEPSNDS